MAVIRDQYQAETAWAPKHVGRELGYVRASAEDARLQLIRSQAEAETASKAGDRELAAGTSSKPSTAACRSPPTGCKKASWPG